MTGNSTLAGRESRLLARAADALLDYTFACWHYGDSIGFEGLLAATDTLDDETYSAFVHGFIRAWAARAEPHRELDNTVAGHALCLVYERTGDRLLLDAAQRLAEFLTLRRRLAGVYASFECAPLIEPYDGSALPADERALLADPGPGAFVDCLHFDPPFLVHLGTLLDDPDLVEAGAQQAMAAVDLLQDRASGIFHHFYLDRTGRRYGYGWSRGQGWALLGLLDVLELLPPGHDAVGPLSGSLRALARAMTLAQDRSGHWPAVIDEPDAFLETSAALFVAAGFARGVRLGLLEPGLIDVAERGYAAGLQAVDEDGVVRGVSQAVWACTARGHYRATPVGEAVPWGQGPLLVAAAALDRRGTG
jgi:unsaturated rhamnogalacturonyl hydrolase